MPTSVIARLARSTACFTGESHEPLLQRLQAAPFGAAPIPEATLEQACLEREVFSVVAWPKHIALHPWAGIQSVIPAPEHLSVVFEGDHVASHAAVLLPRVVKYKEVRGVPGLRVDGWSAGALNLRVLGSSAALSVKGISASAWQEAVDLLGAAVEEADGERRATRGALRAGGSAWLTSGVLRRLPLFTSIGMPVYFTSWPSNLGVEHERWCFDLDHRPRGTDCEHHAFLKALSDGEFGLPLKPVHVACHVDKLGHGSCWIDLGSTDGRPGRLNLRFNRQDGKAMERWSRHFPAFTQARERLWGAADHEPLAAPHRAHDGLLSP